MGAARDTGGPLTVQGREMGYKPVALSGSIAPRVYASCHGQGYGQRKSSAEPLKDPYGCGRAGAGAVGSTGLQLASMGCDREATGILTIMHGASVPVLKPPTNGSPSKFLQ